MNKTLAKTLTAALAAAVLIPLLCSCSLFRKNKLLQAATLFTDSLRFGDSTEILRKTDGLGRDFKKSFREMLDVSAYTEEEQLYAAHVMSTIVAGIDSSSVELEKDKASVDISYTIADVAVLEGGNYDDAQALADAVDKCATKEITITTEFALVEKEWYVTNLDDKGYTELFSFLGHMPAIGRNALINTANQIALSVTTDDIALAVNNSASVSSPDMVNIPEYMAVLFDVNGEPSEEDTVFRDAVLDTMEYEVDESTLTIDGLKGSIVMHITMADYEVLAGKEFKKITDIPDAVKACDTKTLSYTCELVRNGSSWYAVNLESEEFAAFLSYKKFSINLKSVDGTYEATVDITDKFVAYVAKEFNVSMPSDLEGKIYITATLELQKGDYKVTIDRDAFVSNIKTFVETNIDKIITNTLGTTSSVSLNAMAKLAGYKDYADMRQQILDQVTGSLETVDTSGLESSGKFTLNDDVITLKSGTDTMTGNIDNYGVITVTAPVNDADAKKLLGSDTISLPFKKV